jgi:hypothetical protein
MRYGLEPRKVVGIRFKPRQIMGIVVELDEALGINFQASEAMRTNECLGKVAEMRLLRWTRQVSELCHLLAIDRCVGEGFETSFSQKEIRIND